MQMPPLRILAGSVAADYAKRLLDQHGYDRLMTEARRNGFVPQSTAGMAVSELLAYIAGGIADHNMNENSFMAKFLKEIVTDVPSELAKRMLDGERSSTQLVVQVNSPATPIKESVHSGLETLTARINRWAGR